ncbi:hypothetical protein VTL71DRAFT_14064, partial [Oculimacula yallundae]
MDLLITASLDRKMKWSSTPRRDSNSSASPSNQEIPSCQEGLPRLRQSLLTPHLLPTSSLLATLRGGTETRLEKSQHHEIIIRVTRYLLYDGCIAERRSPHYWEVLAGITDSSTQ